MIVRLLVFCWPVVAGLAIAAGDDIEARHLVWARQPGADEAAGGRRIRYWTTNWSFRDIDVATLSRRLAQIGITAPAELAGKVSVEFSVSVPINALRDATAYRLSGSLNSSRLRVESTAVRLRTQVSYANGVARLERLAGDFYASPSSRGEPGAGSFSGRASLRLAGEGARNATVQLDVQRLQLELLTAAIAEDSRYQIETAGTADGRLRWSGPVDSLANIAAWDAEGRLAIQNWSVDRMPPLDVDTGPLRIADGSITLPEFRADVVGVAGAGLTGAFQAQLIEARPWSIRVDSQQLPIDSLAAMLAWREVPATAGQLSVSGEAEGTMTPLDWQIDAELGSSDLAIYGVRLGDLQHRLVSDRSAFELTSRAESAGTAAIDSVRGDFEITPETIELREIDATLLGGSFGGDIQWARQRTATHRANLQWSDLNLRWDIGSVMTGIPAIVSLRTQGRTAWQVAADRIAMPADHSLRAMIQVDQLVLAELPIGSGSLLVRAVDGQLALRGDGSLLGGSFRVDSATELTPDVDFSTWWDDLGLAVGPLSGRVRLRSISLARLADSFRLSPVGAGQGWQGRGDAVVDFALPPAGPTGLETRGSVRVRDFAISRRMISPALTLDFRSSGERMFVDRLLGRYAGGSLQASGQWQLTGAAGGLDIVFSRVDVGRALMPLRSDAGRRFGGELSGRVRLARRPHTSVDGSIEGRSIVADGVPLGTIRSGLSGTLASAQRWEMRLPNVRATLAGGRVSGHVVLSSRSAGPAFDLQSRWSAQHVDFESLIRGFSTSRSVGRGNLTASLEIGGRNIRGPSDLAGRFDGRLGGTAASAVPGLSRARGYLGPIGSDSFTFTNGVVRGQLRRGIVRVDELALRGDRLRVVADGTIRLDNARLDFDAVAATGDFTARNLLLDAAAQRVLLLVAPPVALVMSINQLISDRTVYLQVGGTLQRPQVRLRPLQTAGENLLRFLLREATGVPDPRAI